MKKKLMLLCAAAAAVSLFTGCGDSDVTESTVELKRNGRIVEYTVEDFSESYYDSDELQSYIDSTVEEWNGANEGSVKVKRSEVEDGIAYLTVQYDSAETFSGFNGIECFAGSIVQAQSAGYDFDMDFVEIDSGEDDQEDSSVEAEIQSLVPGETVIEDDDLKVLIIRDHVNIRVPGRIAYISAEHVQVEGGNTVVADEDDGSADHDVLLYVLYK